MNDIYYKFWTVFNVSWFRGLFRKKWSAGFFGLYTLYGWCKTAFHNFGMHKTSRINWRTNFVALLSSKSRSFLSKRIDWNCLTLANDGVKSQNFNDYFCKRKSYNFNFFVLVIMKYILYDEIVHNWNNKMNNIFAVIFSDDLLVSAKTPFRILSMIIIYTL